MALPQLDQDKANHFAYGAAVAYFVGVLALALGAGFHTIAAASAVVVVLVALLKEVYDRVSATGTADPWDVVATLIGGAAVIVPWLVARHVFGLWALQP